MFKNWKTTSAGITMIVGGIAGLYFAIKSGNLNEGTVTGVTTSIMGGIGLILASDGNKAKGTN